MDSGERFLGPLDVRQSVIAALAASTVLWAWEFSQLSLTSKAGITLAAFTVAAALIMRKPTQPPANSDPQ